MAEQFGKLRIDQIAWMSGGVASEYDRIKNDPESVGRSVSDQRPILAKTVGDPCTGVYPEENSGANTFWVVFITGSYPPKRAGEFSGNFQSLQSETDAKYTARNIDTPGWVPEGTEIIIVHDGNQWWFQKVGSFDSSTTTTTPSPVCDGDCRWEWSVSDAAWNLQQNSCSTTAPTTTTASPITTTTAECSTTTPPSTTSTSTTEAPGCDCLYPTYCGTFEGESTSTQCSTQQQDDNTSCPPTTTSTAAPTSTTTSTSCPPTTTTPDPVQCTEGCDYVYAPNGWVIVSNGCNPACACPQPPAGGDICDTFHTPCLIPIPTTIPPVIPSCIGTCDYWCYSPGSNWVLTRSGCFGVNTPCNCAPPSEECDSCRPIQVPCVAPPPPPTTIDPCAPTTSPPTSTTAGPCSGCKWVWNQEDLIWFIIDDNCYPCVCQYPDFNGWIGGQTVITPCGIETTSTTTTADPATTTTTATPTTTTTTQPCENTDCFLRNANGFWEVALGSECDSPCTCRQDGEQAPPDAGHFAWSTCDNTSTTTSTTCNPATDNATWECGLGASLCPELQPSWTLTENNCCEGKVPDYPVALCDCDNFSSPEVVDCNDPVASTSVAPSTTTTTIAPLTTTTTV